MAKRKSAFDKRMELLTNAPKINPFDTDVSANNLRKKIVEVLENEECRRRIWYKDKLLALNDIVSYENCEGIPNNILLGRIGALLETGWGLNGERGARAELKREYKNIEKELAFYETSYELFRPLTLQGLKKRRKEVYPTLERLVKPGAIYNPEQVRENRASKMGRYLHSTCTGVSLTPELFENEVLLNCEWIETSLKNTTCAYTTSFFQIKAHSFLPTVKVILFIKEKLYFYKPGSLMRFCNKLMEI